MAVSAARRFGRSILTWPATTTGWRSTSSRLWSKKNRRRPDVVLFVNGLPLLLIELKNATDEQATIWNAWQQLQTYKAELPTLFAMNAALIVSDGLEARVGTLDRRAGMVQGLAWLYQ